MGNDNEAYLADTEDVEASLLRELTDDEGNYVDILLARSLALIEKAVGSAASEWAEDFTSRAKTVQADMVARRLRNPEGYYQESDGQYSYSRDRNVASGRLELTDEDLDFLGIPSDGFFVWNPQYGSAQ